MRRSRLIIPLAAAAAATYIALVREDGVIRRRRSAAAPAGPAPLDVADRGPVMQPPPMPSRPVYTPKPPVVSSPTMVAPPAAEVVEPRLPADDAPASLEAPPVDAPIAADEPAATPTDSPTDESPTAPVDVFAKHIAPASETEPEQVDASPVEWTEMEGIPELPAAVGATSPEVAPIPEGPILDEGTFSIGGWAAAPGHSVVSAVTYHHRLPVSVEADRIVLHVESAENIPDDGLVVLADPGFAPDREGFTLLLGAAAPGPFSAAGTYRAIG